MSIDDIAGLQQHLQWAIEVEHATIPPYLCAMWSVADPESEAFKTFKYVVREEMLHVALAANLLSATGGSPRFTEVAVPKYPAPLPYHDPHPPLILELGPADVDTVRDVYLRIEEPADPRGGPEPERYETLGQFYEAILLAVRRFAPDAFARPNPQVTHGYAGHGGGTLVAIADLASAELAIDQIVEQGEGSHRTRLEPYGFEGAVELAHYWRFKQIVDSKIALGEVRPMRRNPSTAALPPGPIHDLSALFDGMYSLQLQVMQDVWSRGDDVPLIDDALVPLMNHAQKPVAIALMSTPLDDGTGDHAGPSFAWAPVPVPRLQELARSLSTEFDLGPTVETLDQVAAVVG